MNDNHFHLYVSGLKRMLRLGLFTTGCVVAMHAQTVSISGLYRTGVNNSGTLLGSNVQDAHYVITAIPGSAPSDNLGTSYTVDPAAMPTQWASNTSNARWITTPGTAVSEPGSGGANPRRVAGQFDYTLTFTMPAGAILSTVSITGYGHADNRATFLVNGTAVSGESITGQRSSEGSAFTLNSSNSTFVTGTNTITFRVENDITNTGLLITSLSGTVSVPEVGAVLPLFGAVALYGLVIWRRRTSHKNLRGISLQP